jgi:predicted transcriptional regulator
LRRKTNVTAYVDLEDIEKLESLARKTGKSISFLVCTAIKEFLEKKEVS